MKKINEYKENELLEMKEAFEKVFSIDYENDSYDWSVCVSEDDYKVIDLRHNTYPMSGWIKTTVKGVNWTETLDISWKENDEGAVIYYESEDLPIGESEELHVYISRQIDAFYGDHVFETILSDIETWECEKEFYDSLADLPK